MSASDHFWQPTRVRCLRPFPGLPSLSHVSAPRRSYITNCLRPLRGLANHSVVSTMPPTLHPYRPPFLVSMSHLYQPTFATCFSICPTPTNFPRLPHAPGCLRHTSMPACLCPTFLFLAPVTTSPASALPRLSVALPATPLSLQRHLPHVPTSHLSRSLRCVSTSLLALSHPTISRAFRARHLFATPLCLPVSVPLSCPSHRSPHHPPSTFNTLSVASPATPLSLHHNLIRVSTSCPSWSLCRVSTSIFLPPLLRRSTLPHLFPSSIPPPCPLPQTVLLPFCLLLTVLQKALL
jgi:hypothetical protein